MKIKKSLLSILSIGVLISALSVAANSSYADETLDSPQNVSITINNANSTATISWDPPENSENFQNIEYVVTESPDGQEFTTTNTAQTFENLSIGEHSFTVKARGTNNDGPTQAITQDFAYTGNVQTFTAPYSGNYKLEVWGAQGGNARGKSALDQYGNSVTTAKGGPGGYSEETISLISESKLYIVVGQQGNPYNGSGSVIKGGYNGGGDSSGVNTVGGGGGGGGATHIATKTGVLSSLQKADLLLVAGAGGGAWGTVTYSWTTYRNMSDGAFGGGAQGGTGGYGGTLGYTSVAANTNIYNQNDTRNQAYNYATGGSQSSGGVQGNAKSSLSYAAQSSLPSFGKGGSSANAHSHSGGGGGAGLYGGAGGASGENANGTGGGGGSGYFSDLVTGKTIAGNQTFKSPTGSNETGHTGNGYARITFQGIPATESIPVTVNSEIFEANLNINNIEQTGTNVNVSWSIDENYNNVSYTIHDSITDQTFETSENFYNFTNLSKGLHEFTVKAFNENNQQIAEISKAFSVSVAPSIPNISVTQNGFNQAKIDWSVDDNGGSPITSYNMIIDDSSPVSINASINTKNINLSTGTHEIKLSAVNSIGESDYATSSITIKQLPSQVQNLQIVKSSNKVTVSWTPPAGFEEGQGFMGSRGAFVTEGSGNDEIQYEVESIPAGFSTTTTGTSVTFDLGDEDNTDYQFKVTPIMPFGEGIPNYTGLMSSSNNIGEVNIFVESSISLTLDDDTVDLSEIPGATNVATDDNDMTYTVTTNNLEGYTVTIKADDSTLEPSIVGNSDNIPVDLVTVSQVDSQNGTGSNATALSSTTDNQLYSQDQRSVEAGDTFTSTFNLTEVPWVNADDYTGTITYTATAN